MLSPGDEQHELQPLKSRASTEKAEELEESRRRDHRHRHHRQRRQDSEFSYTHTQERAVVRCLDRHLVLALAGLYMLSFLDRSNIGNAKIAGMKEDLGLLGDRYESLLTAFYLTYIGFQWMTFCWSIFPAHKYVTFCVVGWGIIASLQSLAASWGSMLLLRALLGIFEAAFGPGVPVYLSLFYRREELALRTGLFIAAAPLATAYAGFLAYAITSIPSAIAPWRLLFLAEGFPTVIAGIFAYYYIPDSPSDASFLNLEQKKIARRRLLVVIEEDVVREDFREIEQAEDGPKLKWGDIWRACGDAGNWMTAMMLFFANISFSSLPVFLPTIINEMDLGVGHTPAHSQALSVPPYIFSLAVIITATWLSDIYLSRSMPLGILCGMSCLGYIILALSGMLQKSLSRLPSDISKIETSGSWFSQKVSTSSFLPSHSSTVTMSYVGIMLAAGAIFSIVSLIITWNGNNSETHSGRGTGMIILQLLGQCAPLFGTRLYPSSDGPEYIFASVFCACCMAIVGGLVAVQRWRLKRENRKRDRAEKIALAVDGIRVKKGFRYML